VTDALTLEQRVERIERILGIDGAGAMMPVPWALRRSSVVTEAGRLWGVTTEELTGESRIRALVLPRAAVAMALRCEPAMSYAQIGRLLHRDHSSVIGLERIGHVEFARDAVFAARTKLLMGLAQRPESIS
jgi:hypothetical protein